MSQIRAPRLLSWPTDVPRPLSCPPLTDAPSDGGKVIAWIERHCVQGPGDYFGKPVKLEMFQKLFLTMLFELRPDGRRRYRRCYLQTAKGQGKTSLAAMIAAYQLANQNSAVIPVCAASYDQTEMVFGDLRAMVSESPTLRQVMTPFEGEIQVEGSSSRAFRVAAVAGVNDGLRPSTAIFDEIHELVGPNRSRVHLVIANGLTKRTGSLQFNASTPGHDKETLAGKLHTYGVAVNNGEIVDDEFLFAWWGADPGKFDLTDPDDLRAAIRAASPAADAFCNVEDIAARFHQIPLNEFVRYHLGGWTTSAQAWLPDGAWNDCKDSSITIPDGADVCLGFDGSVNNDSTAIVVVSCSGTPHVDVVECWERDGTDQDWKVPIVDVEEAIRQACRRWSVREIVADPFRWARSLQLLADEGLPVVEFPQNASHMTPATARFYEAVINGGLTHSGDPRLARHIGNAVLKIDARGQRIVKETAYSARKIDLALATVMAFDRAAVPATDDYDIMQSVL
jgi:phage terminase large subunit-like protein